MCLTPLLRLLNWCSDNGIYIHPNVRLVHEKNGICVRAANGLIIPELSRKPIKLTLRYLPTIILSSVSCRNPQVGRPFYPFVCVGRPYPSLALWS